MRETFYTIPGCPVLIALVSDLHERPFGPVLASLERRRPDLICVAGDFLYGYPVEGAKLDASGMLPFFEQQARYQVIAAGDPSRAGVVWQIEPFETTNDAFLGVIPTIICPSDARSAQGTPSGASKPFAACNYRFSHADAINGRGWYNDCKSNNANCPHNSRSVFTMVHSGRGVGHGWCPPFSAVVDGLSNSIFMSERCASPAGRWTNGPEQRIKSGWVTTGIWGGNPNVA